MSTYIIRRLLYALLVLLIVTIMVFLVMRLLPGDPIYLLLSQSVIEESAQEQIAALKHEFGLDKPMVVQYFTWMYGILQGDFGRSIISGRSVAGELANRLPVTFHLGALAMVIGFCVGIPSGVISAVRRGGWLDTFFTTLANIGMTVPIFWLGVMLIYFLSLQLDWLPVYGYTSPFDDFWLSTQQLIMPVFCLAVTQIAMTARQTRSSMLEVMRQDYIRTAWSKGLNERVVILRHALKNGLIPVVTVIGLGLSHVVGGSVLIETVFNIPGMGRLAVSGLFNQDYAITQGVVLIIAIVVVLANLLVDLSYGWLDPRIRYA